MKRGVDEFSVVFGARVFCLFAAIGVQSCLAWSLGPGGRGSFAVCLVFAGLLSVVFAVGCDIASVYLVASKRFSVSEGIIYSVIFAAVSSGLAITAGLILMQFPLSFFDKATATSLHLGLATIPLTLLAHMLTGILTAVREFGYFAIVSVGGVLARLLFVVLFVWVFCWGVNGALVAILTADSLMILGTLILFQWRYTIRWVTPSLNRLRQMLSYGLRYHAGKISNTLNFQIGTMLLAFVATKEEVGLFAVASQLTAKVMIIPDTLTTILIPRVARDNQGGQALLVARCVRLSAVICGIVLAVLALLAKPVVILLFSRAFLPAVVLIQILAFGVLVRSACKVFVSYFIGTNRPGIASLSVAVGTVINLTVLLSLLPAMGLPGAAVAMTAGYFGTSALLAANFSRLSRLRFRHVWSFGRSDWDTLVQSLRRRSSGRVRTSR